MIPSTNSSSSFAGLVSSNLKFVYPPNPFANSKFVTKALACPICKYAFGSGGLTGLGLGQSRQKALYMPEPHTDFIFPIIGEEVGLIGCLAIILVFAILIWKGINIALEAKEKDLLTI